MNIVKTTLWQCQNKEVVSVTMNVSVNRAKTHPNGCSFPPISLRFSRSLLEGRTKTKSDGSERAKPVEWSIRRKLWDVIYLGSRGGGESQKEQGKLFLLAERDELFLIKPALHKVQR
jgi:hypothetical protein